MKKAFLFIDCNASKEEQKQMETHLLAFAEKVHLEVVGKVLGRFADEAKWNTILSTVNAQSDIQAMLFDSMKTVDHCFLSGKDLVSGLVKNGIEGHCVKENFDFGADLSVNFGDRQKAWIMTNAQKDVLDMMKEYAAEKNMEVIHIDTEDVCCDQQEFKSRLIEIIKNNTDVILLPDSEVFEHTDDPSLHALTHFAIDLGIDVIVTDVDYNVTNGIKLTRQEFQHLTQPEKQTVAMAYRKHECGQADTLKQLNELAKEKNYEPACYVELNGDDLPMEFIEDIIDHDIDVVVIDKDINISDELRKYLDEKNIKLQEFQVQDQLQMNINKPYFQA